MFTSAMSQLYIFSLFIVLALAVTVVVVSKYQPLASKEYWFKSFGFAVVIAVFLSGLALYNLFFYGCIVLLVVAAARESSKYIFSFPRGYLVLGVYLGLWLSLPSGAFQLTT